MSSSEEANQRVADLGRSKDYTGVESECFKLDDATLDLYSNKHHYAEETFTVAITLGNSEMQSPEDVAHVLRKIADRLETDPWASVGKYQTIFDVNGNDVGRFRLQRNA